MSGKATGWALEQPVKGTTKLVLIALADECRRDGTTCFINRRSIAEVAGLSVKNPRQVSTHLRKLEEMGLIRSKERNRANGGRTSNLYELAIDGTFDDSTPVQEASSTPLEENCKAPLKPGLQGPPCSSPQEHVVEPSQKEPEDEPVPPLPPTAEDRFPDQVDRKPVTDDERALAVSIVETFNSEFDTAFTAAAHAKSIIGRLREQPELGLEQHAGIIATIASGRKWWDDRLSPAIIYGNPAQFERCHEQWRQTRKVRRLSPSTEGVYWDGPLSEPPGPKTPTDPEKAWIEIGDELVEHQGFPELSREQWIDTATAVEIDADFRLVIESDQALWLQRKYAPLLKTTAQWIGLAGIVIRYSPERAAA